ncbi:HEPN domain-containing protein [Comamonas composti]|uniref:HEPN domain-containing protein n=1 Tax=Comamonas composti TaxID=408558 RepID=UPI000A07A833|nr:HEPN domain-containing protein [Comamonas composti]
MPWPVDVLINNFAIRSFRETADKDYITARMAYRARLIQPYRWSALHCLEKYIKGICLLNRIKSHSGHSVLAGVELIEKSGKLSLDLSPATKQFISHLEESGAEFRYYEASYYNREFDIIRLDKAVWEIRRYCQPLNYEINLNDGTQKNMLHLNLERVKNSVSKKEKGSCITGGVLENIIKDKNHPARKSLVWNNLFFGPSKRKSVKMRPDWECGNSPFFLHPEIIDEVVKYVHIPKRIATQVRDFAQQQATKKTASASEEAMSAEAKQ